jgi:hypothetical protein
VVACLAGGLLAIWLVPATAPDIAGVEREVQSAGG